MSARLLISVGVALGAALVGAAVVRRRSGTSAIRRKTASQTASATATGSVLKLATRGNVVLDSGIHFWVSVKNAKAEAGRKASGTTATKAAGPPKDPFERPEEALLVEADLTPTHYLQLNKFPIVDDHLLIVTKRFEAQTDVADGADFAAIGAALAAVDGFVFFNCGAASGASQPHKHFQLLPRDTLQASQGEASLPFEIPMEGVVLSALANSSTAKDGVSYLPPPLSEGAILAARLPDGWWRWTPQTASGGDEEAPEAVAALYEALLTRLGLPIARDGVDHCRDASHPSHNMVLTRGWMVVAARRCEPCAETGLGSNACGFGGFFLVRDEAQLAALTARGPARALVDLCRPRPA